MIVAADMREQALLLTPDGLSQTLLQAMPELVAHAGPNPASAATYYQDCELRGAICATAEEATLLYLATFLCQPVLALEIGSYVGWTAAHIASGIEEGGTLLCVDDFSESADGPKQMMRLAANLDRAGVSDRVRIVTGQSPEILDAAVHDLLDLAFVDGGHKGEQPQRDVQAVARLMAPDGVIAVHDTWMPDVQRACYWLRDNNWFETTFDTPGKLAFYYREEPIWWEQFTGGEYPDA